MSGAFVTPYHQDAAVTIYSADAAKALRLLDAGSVRTCVTSPPYYGLRDYGHAGQIGLEETPEDYVERLVQVFREVRRCLAADGTLWLNLGDSYAASGRGGNPEDSPHQKQASNRGSRQFFQSEAVEAGAIGRRWVKPPPGYKPKDLIGIPWMVAFALRADGWFLRQDLIWHKPNPMPESVQDRCTKAHEYIFLLSKSARYFWDRKAMQEPSVALSLHSQTSPGYAPPGQVPHSGNRTRSPGGRRGVPGAATETSAGSVASGVPWEGFTRNRRSVWSVVTQPYKAAHFATFPPKLIEPCVLAGSAPGDLVLDPFAGTGTTGLVAKEHGRRAVLIELNPEYAEMAARRVSQHVLSFGGGGVPPRADPRPDDAGRGE